VFNTICFIESHNVEGVEVGSAAPHVIVDVHFSHFNLEVTVLSPAISPRVGTEPIVQPILVSIAKDFDGMTPSKIVVSFNVDPTTIAEEVVVYQERGIQWSIVVEFILDGIDASRMNNGTRLAFSSFELSPILALVRARSSLTIRPRVVREA
jgi:hypothetical protein